MKFKIFVLSLTAAFFLTMCKNEVPKSGLTRVEQVNLIPYRSLKVSDSLSSELLRNAKYLWEMIEKSAIEDGIIVLFIEERDGFQIVDIERIDVRKMRKMSYDLWKDNEVALSALLYKSSSVNTQTNEQEEFHVVELEHKDLTGTFIVFISDDSHFTTSYVDRN